MTAEETGTERVSVLTRLRRPVGQPRSARPGFGGVPQVSLLPTEVRLAGSAAHHRKRLVAAVALAAAVAVAGVVVASGAERAAQDRLSVATAQAATLRGQLAKFDDVRVLEQDVAVGKAAVKVGGATTVDWKARISDMEADKPSGYTVESIDASSASPLIDYPQGATVVEPRRAATVVMTLHAASVGNEFSVWLRRLRSIRAYADVTGTTAADATDGVTITVTCHFSAAAITNLAPESE